jgi:hypothetical protein
MNQPESDIQSKTEVNQEPERPFSIRLTQIWLAVVGVLPLLGGLFALLRILYDVIKEPAFLLEFNSNNAVGLMKLSLIIGFGIYALVTIWCLQKRARVSRWLALIVICFATARTAYYTLWSKEFWIENWPAELLFVDGTIALSIALLQLTMLYRFAFGKAERAFLSK